MKDYRIKCDYCRRIIKSDDSDLRPCSACGHGKLRQQRPQNYCHRCDEPIYDNTDPKKEVICGNCTTGLVEEIERKEKVIGQDFRITEDMKIKEALWNERMKTDGGKLRMARLQKGWTSRRLAAALGISQTYIVLMEKNHRPLINKALDFIGTSARPTGEEGHFSNHQPIENKQVTDTKNMGQ